MRKGQRTKQIILEKAMGIFNEKGYLTSSMVDVMNATGLERGGLYHHFDSRDELVLQAFNLALEKMSIKYNEALFQNKNLKECLVDFVRVFSNLYNNEPFAGGCPIMNVAIQSDTSYPELKEKARKAINWLHNSITVVLTKALDAGDVSLEMKIDEFVTILLSSLEGALMISRLHEDKKYLNQMVNYLEEFIHTHIKFKNGVS
jgi:TetR/AcrR family transcriptional repressor of nem operon